jgi:hypothetical protein
MGCNIFLHQYKLNHGVSSNQLIHSPNINKMRKLEHWIILVVAKHPEYSERPLRVQPQKTRLFFEAPKFFSNKKKSVPFKKTLQ